MTEHKPELRRIQVKTYEERAFHHGCGGEFVSNQKGMTGAMGTKWQYRCDRCGTETWFEHKVPQDRDRGDEVRRLIGNFKVKTVKHVSAQKRREGNSERHLASIRQLPCCVCGAAPPNDPHHLKSAAAGKERAFGRRATDQHTVPMCRHHHDEVERVGTRGELALFEQWHLLDIHALAKALWDAPDDLNVRRAIVMSQHWKD